jgi:AcrR family transcriptional regulator
MDEIGAAAGVTGPAIYSHFPGKTGLLVAIFDRCAEELFDFGVEISEDESPEDALRRLVSHHVDFVLNNRSLI